MYFDERRAHFLTDRLQRRLKACRIDTFYSYYRLLTSREGKAELTALLEILTVNETSFFRNKPQLDLFQKSILEETLRRKQDRRDWTIRVWSAGCSTGQEPFTLAMQISDALAYYYCGCGIQKDILLCEKSYKEKYLLVIYASTSSTGLTRVVSS